MMSEKRFVQSWNMHRGLHYLAIEDKQEKKIYCVEQYIVDVEKVADLLNEQQDTIKHLEEYSGDLEYDNKTLSEENKQLKERLEKINGGYGNLTHYKGLTANEWLIQGQERELKKKDKQISEWIEQHGKDVAKISEQNKLIQKLKEENDKLLKQIAEYDCEDCINYKSYCFDEYDSDCYCLVFDEFKKGYCEKFERLKDE